MTRAAPTASPRLFAAAPHAAIAATALFLVFCTHVKPGGWNDASRLAMTEAIVEHGHLWVDGTEMSRFTGDVARIDGRFYSDKPPALALLAVPVYAAEVALGITFRRALARAYYWTTLLTVGLITVLGLVALERFLRHFVSDPRWRAATILAVGLGTLNTAFSVTFSNHPPSAIALLASFLFLWRWRRFGGGMVDVAASALLVGVSALTDHGAAFYMPAFLAYVAWPGAPRRGAATLVFAGVTALSIVGYALYAFALSGSPLPLPLQPALFDYPGSYFRDTNNLAGSAIPHRSIQGFLAYVWLCLFGYRGVFSHTPLLLFITLGMLQMARWREHPRRIEALVVLVPTTVLTTYYLVTSNHPGGNAYGVRWFCLFMPAIYVFLVDTHRLLRRRAMRALFWTAYALSIVLALIGAVDPWMDPTPWGVGYSWQIVLRSRGWL